MTTAFHFLPLQQLCITVSAPPGPSAPTWLPFLPSPAWGRSHSHQDTDSLISTILSPHSPVPKPRSSDHVPNSRPLPGCQPCWKSRSPPWLHQQCFLVPLVISFCPAPQQCSKPSPFSYISCSSLRALRKQYTPQYKQRL